ncbi:EAL domain-containing protein [Pseudomonas sp. LS44]|uniref:phosphodiesterase DibA n=1 Tax=Pseudomonas sp. LS44 TaxID=1357074 RepID=UPI00215A0E73|nr:EAL domain-containing protein [Pseudomonas sp. LS44]UVE18026.1 EAL domain-containing protein [Pseudomonas sp. LS44]
MTRPTNAWRLALIYLVLACLWIFFSDFLLSVLPFGTTSIEVLQLLKGLLFVGLTALLLYGVLRIHERRQYSHLDILQQHSERLRQAAAVFESTQEGVLVTDQHSCIMHVNPAFTRITGYEAIEALGQNPRLLKSGRHDAAFYQEVFRTIAKHGAWSGEIWNRRKNGEIYPQWHCIRAIHDEAGALSHYVAVFSDISALKRSQHELDHLAHHEPLCDLPNRLLFTERVGHALSRTRETQHGGAVLQLDLDHFKHINESFGHSVGDQLLKQVSERLKLQLRENMTLARLGGDEFALLCEDCAQPEQAAALAQQLLDAMREPFSINAQDLFITASIGICLYPGDAQSADNLMRNADSALFKAKSSGRERFVFYSHELTEYSRQLVELAVALRQALDQQQLRAYFQPVIDLHSGQVIGSEALVRWQHPQRGLVPPGEFIPIAEKSGLIAAIDIWMLEQACQQLCAWRAEGQAQEFVAVNISSRLFCRGELDLQVARILAATGLAPERLELEVTESAVMLDPDAALDMMRRLRQLGVHLAIDDFGTGYSSLMRLKDMPVHKLKIDQSFVRGLPHDNDDLAIARSVITLGHSLGLKVLAEGIEQPEQAELLRQLGCNMGQGYLFGRPQPAADWPRPG